MKRIVLSLLLLTWLVSPAVSQVVVRIGPRGRAYYGFYRPPGYYTRPYYAPGYGSPYYSPFNYPLYSRAYPVRPGIAIGIGPGF
jgi:hypothetical protein